MFVAIHRDDGEHVGWLVPTGSGFAAVSLLGHLLGDGADEWDAAKVAVDRGLTAVMDPWWARMPDPMFPGADLREPADDWQWRRVVVTELRPGKATVQLHYPAEQEQAMSSTLDLPLSDVLFLRPGPDSHITV